MNLSGIKTLVTSKVVRQTLVVKKNSPTLMFGAGIAGVVTTAVLASRATLKLDEVLKEHETKLHDIKTIQAPPEKYSEDDRKKDRLIVQTTLAIDITKLYGPAVLSGVLTIALLTKSHTTLTKRNAGLMAAYAALEKGFEQYRKRVVDEMGEDKDREFRYGSRDATVVDETDEGLQKIIVTRVGDDTPSVYAKFFDETNKEWKRNADYNRTFLRCQQNFANDMLRARGHLFLNEVYDMLGFERTSAGSVVGWVVSLDGDNFVDFGVFNGDSSKARDFVNGHELAILLDFNVDGVIYDKI